MLITSMKPRGKTNTVIELDEDIMFVLSNKDAALYGLKEGGEFSEDLYESINEQLRKDVIRKAGTLLKGMDYTSSGLRDKLIRGGYTEEIADYAVLKMKEAHYIDDRRYAQNYIKYHLNDKSAMRIKIDLQAKGLSRELVNEAFAEYEADGDELIRSREAEQINKALKKKHYDPDSTTYEERQKIQAFLLRKGFSSDAVRNGMDSYGSDNLS